MKIVQLIHGFPPYNMVWPEVYTYNLSQELVKEDEVYVFHRIAEPELEEYEMSYRTYDGLNVCTINNTFKNCDYFEKTYKNDVIAQKMWSFLHEVNSGIAHFGHVTFLSTSPIEKAQIKKTNQP